MATISRQTEQAIRRYAPMVDPLARQRYGIKGRQLLRRLVAGESGDNPNAVSSAGARGRTQFMPGTRTEVMQKYGIDPWGSADEAVHAAALHLTGKLGHAQGLEGYNPGSPTYTRYILGQRPNAPKVGGGGGGSVRIPGRADTRRIDFVHRSGVDQDSAILDALIARRGKLGGESILKDVARRLDSGDYTTDSSTPVIVGQKGTPDEVMSSGGGGDLGGILQRANRIDRAQLPYQWGGGHARAGGPLTPLDCSGAVSRVLGVNPMVSGAFAKWGKPGEGRNVTIYANGEHVLMKINGRFWGTSRSNPGGGAGWIPASAVSKAYLSRFTARHPAGL